ncbi:hypothetical protein [Allosalinactinospora lopnorensis]|nr:hypothetical protein [Allosalinactinospora lopnorensis]
MNRRSAEIWDTAAHGWSLVPGGYEVLAGRSYADIRLSARVDVPA